MSRERPRLIRRSSVRSPLVPRFLLRTTTPTCNESNAPNFEHKAGDRGRRSFVLSRTQRGWLARSRTERCSRQRRPTGRPLRESTRISSARIEALAADPHSSLALRASRIRSRAAGPGSCGALSRRRCLAAKGRSMARTVAAKRSSPQDASRSGGVDDEPSMQSTTRPRRQIVRRWRSAPRRSPSPAIAALSSTQKEPRPPARQLERGDRRARGHRLAR